MEGIVTTIDKFESRQGSAKKEVCVLVITNDVGILHV
jgi:hypothetical protein